MSANNIKVVQNPGPTRTYDVDDRTTSAEAATIKPGEPCKSTGSGGNFARILESGDPEVAVDEFIGIARKESTEVSATDGTVEIITLLPQTVLRGDATTSTNVNTAAKLLGLKNDWVTFDFAASVFTINENEGTDPNVHGLKVIDGDFEDFWLDVIVHMNCTELAPLIGQTMD